MKPGKRHHMRLCPYARSAGSWFAGRVRNHGVDRLRLFGEAFGLVFHAGRSLVIASTVKEHGNPLRGRRGMTQENGGGLKLA